MTRTCLMRPVKKQNPTCIMVRWTIIFRSNKPYLVLLTNLRMIFAQKQYLILSPSISTMISWFLEWLEFCIYYALFTKSEIIILYIVVCEYGICLI